MAIDQQRGGGGNKFVWPSSRSSVTKFGGHHPLLGHLVMKHGGHKDLAELASLARIERETGAWATFAINLLPCHPPATTLPLAGVHWA